MAANLVVATGLDKINTTVENHFDGIRRLLTNYIDNQNDWLCDALCQLKHDLEERLEKLQCSVKNIKHQNKALQKDIKILGAKIVELRRDMEKQLRQQDKHMQALEARLRRRYDELEQRIAALEQNVVSAEVLLIKMCLHILWIYPVVVYCCNICIYTFYLHFW